LTYKDEENDLVFKDNERTKDLACNDKGRDKKLVFKVSLGQEPGKD